MKRRLTLAAAALCLLLAACGQPDAEASDGKEPYDGGDVETLLSAGIFSEMPEELDGEIACGLFGIDPSDVSKCTAYLPTSTNAEALALFELSGGADASAVEAACRSWVEDQIESYRDYGPTHVPKLEGAVISVRENTVLLVVGSDPAAAQAAVDGLE